MATKKVDEKTIEISEKNVEVIKGLLAQRQGVDQAVQGVCSTIINEKGDPAKRYNFDEETMTLKVVEEEKTQ